MLGNFFKTAYRNLSRKKGYSLINLLGLALGLASCLLILLYVQHELSYDRFHPNADRIYRVGYEVSLGSGSKTIASSPYRLAGALKNDFPQLHKVTHFSRLYTGQVMHGDKVFRESGIAFADSNFFDVFNFTYVKGNPEIALNFPNQVVITDKFAQKYFDSGDPIGQTLEVETPYSDDFITLTVAGVIREMPSNTHFHMNLLISMPTGETVFSDNLRYNWGWDSHYTYVVLPEKLEAGQFQASLLNFGDKYLGDDEWFQHFFAQKITEIHLYSSLNSEIEANGSITFVYIFSAVALIILVIACVNYMNLATARAIKRAKEVGIRKTVGAGRWELIGQFLGEAALLVFISLIAAFIMAELALPFFNELAGKNVQIDLFENAWIYSGFVALALLVGLISGSYPALFLSSFKPVEVLKSNRVKTDKGVPSLRKVLVVVQFTISIVLIIGTLIAYNQLDFLRNKDLGAETGQVVIVPVQSSTIANNFETIRSELLRHSNIREVASSNRRIGRNIDSGSFYSVINSNGERISSRLSNVWVGWDFIDLYNIQMLYGRGFSRSYISDTTRNAVIINREAARVLDLEPEQAVGQEIKAGGHFKGTIVGVAEDFHFEALYNRIKPMVFIMNPDYINYVSVKIASRDIPETMHHIRTVWKSFEPERIFISSFLDQDLHKIYMAEERFIKVFSLFTGLAIFTACLGIFGLAMFTASQKTREIGIRKVLGATVADILELLTKEFMLLVGAAFIVAAPIAYLVMKAWLQQFPYKTSIDIEMFVISGLMTLVIAWLAVSWQSLKAAMMNPIDSLRHE